MVEFTMELAGVAIQVECNYEETKRRCRDFLAEGGSPAKNGSPAEHSGPAESGSLEEHSLPVEHVIITPELLEEERAITQETQRRELSQSTAQPQGEGQSQNSAQSRDLPQTHAPMRDELVEFSALHRAVAERLVKYGMIVFHSSAICVDGDGFLFTAKSGTGKSTHARIWREVLPGLGHEVRMVNDDKPFLKCTEEGIFVCGSPWNGKHRLGENMQVPVRAIGLICRDERNYVKPIPEQDTWLTLMRQAHILRGESSRVEACLAMLGRVSKEVPMYEIHCNMEPEAATVAYEGLSRR